MLKKIKEFFAKPQPPQISATNAETLYKIEPRQRFDLIAPNQVRYCGFCSEPDAWRAMFASESRQAAAKASGWHVVEVGVENGAN